MMNACQLTNHIVESGMGNSSFPHFPLAELHAHLGASIDLGIYWQIAHEQGIRLPTKDYHEFIEFVTLSENSKSTLNDWLNKVLHPVLEPISSGTHAVDRGTYEIFSGAYRSNNITLLELRNNPMKHNHNGQIDLDYVILAMLRGMERALLEYPMLSAGLIFCMAREFSYEQNEVIVEKAIKYHKRGVVAIDFAGPANPNFHFEDYKELIKKAKAAGLRVTSHSGEVKEADDMWEALEFVEPDRIGHGIRAAYDKELMRELVKRDVVLEVCPMSNLVTQAVENWDEIAFILRTFIENNVKFTINTDWPETIVDAHLRKQYSTLLEKSILTAEELERCNKIAFESSFIPGKGLEPYL